MSLLQSRIPSCSLSQLNSACLQEGGIHPASKRFVGQGVLEAFYEIWNEGDRTQLGFNSFSWECHLLGVLPFSRTQVDETESFHGVTSQKKNWRWWQVLVWGFICISRVESVSVQEEFWPQDIPHPFANPLDTIPRIRGLMWRDQLCAEIVSQIPSCRSEYTGPKVPLQAWDQTETITRKKPRESPPNL